MNRVGTWVVAFASATCLLSCAEAGELVVSPGVMTPHEALAKVREAKRAGDRSAWTVRVKSGRYEIVEPLVFGPDDSGSGAAPFRWIGETGAVFSAGVQVSGWVALQDGTWEAPVSTLPNGKLAYLEQLWVNGRRATRSCIPGEGRFSLGPTTFVAVTNGADVYWRELSQVTNSEIRAILEQVPTDELRHASLSLVNCFSSCRRIVFSYDAKAGVLETRRGSKPMPWDCWDPKHAKRSRLENVRSGFRKPGDWFLDVVAQKVRYRPLPGEQIGTVDAVGGLSKRSVILRLDGVDDKKTVHDIVFDGLTFAHTGIPVSRQFEQKRDPSLAGAPPGMTQTYSFQAGVNLCGAIVATEARSVEFRNCRIEHTGNFGIELGKGCRRCLVADTTLNDLGGGGVRLGPTSLHDPNRARMWLREELPGLAMYDVVSNCTVSGVGRVHPESCGVVLFHCSDSKVLHCDIHDCPYTGVSSGWSWGYGGSRSQRNEIAYNHIWDIGKGLMNDFGGIYVLGTSFATHVHDNVIHDLDRDWGSGFGLYCDEGSEGVIMERNLCWNVDDCGFFMNYGTGSVIRNNIFAWSRNHAAVHAATGLRRDMPNSLHFVNNIVVTRDVPLTSTCSSGKPGEEDDSWHYRISGVWAGNLWYDYGGKPRFDEKLDWAAWKVRGKDIASEYGDPQFVDPERFDFRLKPNSPAFKLGFKAWDVTKAGRKRP